MYVFLLLFLAVGGSFVGGFPPPGGILVFTASTYSFVISWRGKVKWFKIAGVYSMMFKVPALRDEIGDPLNIYIVLTMIFHPLSCFLERVERR